MKKLTTGKGYDFFEAASAFQKAIRRGDEDRALFFAAEFYLSGYDEYLWKRIRVITSEDVGLADPHMPATIHALYSTYKELRKKNTGQPSERLMLIQAVLLLARARKSRLVCHASIATFRSHAERHLEILDHELDVHTRRGRRMGRDYGHFFEFAGALENEMHIDGDLAYLQMACGYLRGEKPGGTPDAAKDGPETSQIRLFDDADGE